MKQTDIQFQAEIESHLKVLRSLQTPTGLFTASASSVKTGYNKAWLRDVFFMTLAFQETNNFPVVQKAAKALLGILCKHQSKIDWATHNKPLESWQYIHARYNPETFDEYWEEWGNKQNDAVGEVLFLLSACEKSGHSAVETEEEREMVQMLVDYLHNVEYWQDSDSGIWEEYQELHASSVGASVAGLRQAKSLPYITIPEGAIEKGEAVLRKLLPRESDTKTTDLALLSLIYPFAVTTDAERDLILERIERENLRERGVIRYKGDAYYARKTETETLEAEWCFGLSWLAIIYANMEQVDKATDFLEKAKATVTADGLVPELYYGGTDTPNENTPLGWAESMYIVANKLVADLYNKN
jgi:phosphorylase kinase alpha/beta subunit